MHHLEAHCPAAQLCVSRLLPAGQFSRPAHLQAAPHILPARTAWRCSWPPSILSAAPAKGEIQGKGRREDVDLTWPNSESLAQDPLNWCELTQPDHLFCNPEHGWRYCSVSFRTYLTFSAASVGTETNEYRRLSTILSSVFSLWIVQFF